MLRMDQVHVIRHKVLVEGVSIRQTARQMGLSRNTVRKYLDISEPKRIEKRPRNRPVFSEVEARVEAILAEWQSRTTRKQRITGTRLHKQLMTEGYKVGITTIRDHLREKRRKKAEVFIPLTYRAGDVAQVDFFEVTVEIQRVRRKAWMFVMHLMYSKRTFAVLYDHCDQPSFFDGHVRAFMHFGAVPQRLVYDNLTPAVKRVLRADRDLTTRFLALKSHYLFEASFARPGEGHDKGGVENSGKAVRLQKLTPIPRGESLADISRQLIQDLDGEMTWKKDTSGRFMEEKFREELPRMISLPENVFEPGRMISAVISKHAKVRVEGADYSVPSRWARLSATVYIGAFSIRIHCLNEVETFPRGEKGTSNIRYRHYLPELMKKPQAVRQVAPELIAELGEPYGKLWNLLVATHEEKEAARTLSRILAAMVDHGEQKVTAALTESLQSGNVDLLALSTLIRKEEATTTVEVPETLAGYQVETGSLADFDHLLLEATP